MILTPLVIGGVFIGSIVLAFLLLRGKIKDFFETKRHASAAAKALEKGELNAALESFLLAKQPRRAAELAHRLGRVRQAADLYVSLGEIEQAASIYREVGMNQRADALLNEAGHETGGGEEAPTSAPPLVPTESPQATASEAREAIAQFHQATSSNAHGKEGLQELGRRAAEACLETGMTQEAATIFHEAGLTEEAINLHIHVLGDLSSAAALCTIRGEHDRAASLFEAVGDTQRSLASWVRWAARAADPLLHFDEVERLSDSAGEQFLAAITENRFLNSETVDLFYKIASEYENRHRPRPSVALFEKIEMSVPGFKDVDQRITDLKKLIHDEERETFQRGRGPAQAIVKPRSELPNQLNDLERRPTDPAPPPAADLGDLYPDEVEETTFDSLAASSVEALAKEVAFAAARDAARLVRSSTPPPRPFAPDALAMRRQKVSTQRRAKGKKSSARGLEKQPINMKLADDPLVEAARQGPAVEELQALIGGNEPDLSNIEVFYRLGLAQAAAGRWREAHEAFLAVEETSPGYRDASKRAQEFSSWEHAMDPETDMANHISDRYELLGEIGRGGMAVVYRARDLTLGREVALKFLSEEVSNHEVMLEVFKREARSAAQLNHPNIVTLYDVGTMDDRAFISMEFIEGQTIEELLDEQGKLTVFDALRIAENILNALDYAHSKHIVHRDLKPSNMMRNEIGVVKLMDFGLAKSFTGHDKTTIIAGTPLYMAPEQFTGKDLDAATDVFAFGATLYEMLTGQAPFEGMLRDAPPPPLTQLNPAVPVQLEKMVSRSLEFDKNDRFKNAGEMLRPTRKALTAVKAQLNKPSIVPPP